MNSSILLFSLVIFMNCFLFYLQFPLMLKSKYLVDNSFSWNNLLSASKFLNMRSCNLKIESLLQLRSNQSFTSNGCSTPRSIILCSFIVALSSLNISDSLIEFMECMCWRTCFSGVYMIIMKKLKINWSALFTILGGYVHLCPWAMCLLSAKCFLLNVLHLVFPIQKKKFGASPTFPFAILR